MVLRFPALIALGAVFAHVPAAASAQGWSSYSNDRYGTFSEVPPGFVMQPPPANDDGRTFKAADGAVLRVFAHANAFDDTPASYARRRLGYGGIVKVTLRKATATWAVISGTQGSLIVYEKYLFKDNFIHHMTIEYPASHRSIYDPIVARLAASLKAP
jgi:hypothetical protein